MVHGLQPTCCNKKTRFYIIQQIINSPYVSQWAQSAFRVDYVTITRRDYSNVPYVTKYARLSEFRVWRFFNVGSYGFYGLRFCVSLKFSPHRLLRLCLRSLFWSRFNAGTKCVCVSLSETLHCKTASILQTLIATRFRDAFHDVFCISKHNHLASQEASTSLYQLLCHSNVELLIC